MGGEERIGLLVVWVLVEEGSVVDVGEEEGGDWGLVGVGGCIEETQRESEGGKEERERGREKERGRT